MSVLVSGATTSEIPSPNSRTYGSTSTSVDGGGMSVDGSLERACHGSVSAGIRASHSRPPAMISGPTTRNGRAPMRPASVPTRVESSVSRIPVGRPMSAGRGRRVAERRLQEQALDVERSCTGRRRSGASRG